MASEDQDQDIYLAKRFISLKEAARYLDVSYHFMWKKIGREDGPPIHRIGRCWRVPKDEFIEWAKNKSLYQQAL